MDWNRLLELAINALQRQKAGIHAEIETLQSEMSETGSISRQMASPSAGVQRGRKRAAAERKLHSEKMKAYWAAKKAVSEKKAPASDAQVKPTAQTQKNNARSLAMQEAWKKRKAAAKKAKIK